MSKVRRAANRSDSFAGIGDDMAMSGATTWPLPLCHGQAAHLLFGKRHNHDK
jgi:hypothetical protein